MSGGRTQPSEGVNPKADEAFLIWGERRRPLASRWSATGAGSKLGWVRAGKPVFAPAGAPPWLAEEK
jgi:hypothetical protein